MSQFLSMAMNYGRTDGASRWLAGAVRTLQKRVELLEAKDSVIWGDDDRVASSVRCRSQSQTPRGCVDDGSGGHAPCCSRQLGSSFSVDDDSGSHAFPLAPTPSCLRESGTSSYAEDDLQDVDNMDYIPPSAPTPLCLTQLGSSFGANDDLQDMEHMSGTGMSPMRGSGLVQTSTISSAITRVKDSVDVSTSFCVPRRKVVRELDISDLNPRVCKQNSAGELDHGHLTKRKRVETPPVRHVSFAEKVEVGEFEMMQAENNVGETRVRPQCVSDQPLMSCTAVMHHDDGDCSAVAPATPKRGRVSHRDPCIKTPSPSKKRRERARPTRMAMWEKTRWSRHVDGLLADILAEGPPVVVSFKAQPGEGDRPCDDSSSRIGGPLADDAEGIPAMAGGLPTTAEEEQGEEEDIEGEVLLEDEGTEVAKSLEGETQLEAAFVEASAALDDIRGRLIAARLTNGWRFLAGAARVEAMEYSKKAMWALERSVENLLRIWSVGEDDEERDRDDPRRSHG